MKKPKQKKDKSLSRTTKLLSINSFFTDVSTEMIVPILPFFLTQTLGASAFILGIIEGWAEVSVSLLDMLSGWFSDKFKRRKPFVIFGYSLSAVMKPLFSIAASWPQLFLFYILGRAGKGIRRVPRDAMIGSAEKETNLGRAFGLRKMLDSAGAILGPIIAAIILFYFGGKLPEEEIYRNIFLLSVIPAAIGVLFLLFTKEKKEELKKISSKTKLLSKNFSHFLTVAAFFSLSQLSISFFILKSGEALPLVFIPIAYLGYNAIYTMFSLPVGIFTDVFGPKKMLTAAYILFAIICFLFAFPLPSEAVFLLFGLLGLFMAIMQTTPRTYLVKTTPGHRYASAIGAYQGLTGLLFLPANLIAGTLWAFNIEGMHLPFLFSGAIALIAALAFILIIKEPKSRII